MNQPQRLTFPALLVPCRKKLAAAFLCLFFANLLALALPWGVKLIVDEVLPQKNAALLGRLTLVLLAIILLRSLLAFGKKYYADVAGENILAEIRRRVYWQVQRMSLLAINQLSPAQIFSRMTRDVESVRNFIFGDALDFIYAVLNFVIITGVLFLFNVKLTLAALLAFPLFVLVYFRFIPRLKERYDRLGAEHGRLAGRMGEVLNGMRTVRVFAAEAHEQERFGKRQQKILQLASRTHLLNAGLWVGMEFFTSASVVAILWLGGRLVINNELTAGELVAFYTYLGMLFSPLLRMVIIHSSFQEARAALDRVNEIISAQTAPESRTETVPKKIQGRVEFRNVSFGYSSGEPALADVSFTVAPKEVIGIVGASGAGKSTLVNLLLRLFDPDAGEILIDGQPLRDLDIAGYRRQLAVVLQDDFLFEGSIRENIAYGTFDVSTGRTTAAAQAAQAHGFIDLLPDKYNSRIAERGADLSCGQRQRLAIARALVRDPAILIMDEATSAVDALTENLIQKAIKNYLPQATVFMVAHRFSTIMEADRIIVLEKGKIVEIGSHEELLQEEGFYCRLYHEQFKTGAQGRAVSPAAVSKGVQV